MLDARGDHVIAGRHESCNREIVALGPSAGENDFGGAASEQLRHRLARIFDRSPRLLPMMMNGRGIAESLPKPGAHSLKHLGQDRGSGVVIEIDAVHTEPISILRDCSRVGASSAEDSRDGCPHMDLAFGGFYRWSIGT